MMDAGTAIVRQRIRIAQEALNARMLDLTASREDSGELLEIAKAMRMLADLKKALAAIMAKIADDKKEALGF